VGKNIIENIGELIDSAIKSKTVKYADRPLVHDPKKPGTYYKLTDTTKDADVLPGKYNESGASILKNKPVKNERSMGDIAQSLKRYVTYGNMRGKKF
jgi:hypothetical protein